MDVENVDMSTTMLGSKVALPFYVTATALGKLGNPEGEVVLTRAARKVCFCAFSKNQQHI